jgi:LysR family transcriptional activator of nhaA
MDRLNYQHLQYVWMTAREGTLARAAERLHLVPSTLSSQIHDFEAKLGAKLFERRGRKLQLTEAGRTALRYADEIFSLGQEMQVTLQGDRAGEPLRLVVGVLDVLSKPLVHRILDPMFAQVEDLRITCREDGGLEEFLLALGTFELDVILSDTPADSGRPVRVFNHLLGETDTTFLAAPSVARSLRRGFPGSLHGADVLLPGRKSEAHRALGQWFESHGLQPRIVGEIDDSALLELFGQMGRGVFTAPSVDERDVARRYGVEVVGRVNMRQRIYAITGERRIRHPAVVALTERARRRIFGQEPATARANVRPRERQSRR